MSPGYSSSEGIDRHVRIAFDHFTKKMGVPSSRIVLFGCSVGTGPSAKLAAALQKEGTPVGCIVMQSPYTSIREAAASLVGFVAYIIFERWDTAGYLRKVRAPPDRACQRLPAPTSLQPRPNTSLGTALICVPSR